MRALWVRRCLCGAWILACAVLIGFKGGTATFLLFWAALMIPLFAKLYQLALRDCLQVALQVADHTILRGERTHCTLTLVNNSILPIPFLRIQLTGGKIRFPDTPDQITCSLKPRETKTFHFDPVCLHCGASPLGAQTIVMQDPFALFQVKQEKTDTVTVLPRMRQITTLLIAPPRQVERTRTARTYFGEKIPDGQLRPYVPGDDVRYIHWKASQLQGRPIQRTLAPEPKKDVVLLPDARASVPQDEAGWLAQDSIVEGVLTIADYFLRHNTPLRVVPDLSRTLRVGVRSDYLTLYDRCAHGFFAGTARPDEVLEADMALGDEPGSYILFTWELDEAFVRRVSRCIDVGAQVTVVYVGDQSQAKALASAQRRLQFYQVTAQNDIFAVLSGSEKREGVQ